MILFKCEKKSIALTNSRAVRQYGGKQRQCNDQLGFGAITKQGFDVCAKRVSIRRRCLERVVEVYVHLTEERVELVVHRCHMCIGGQVGADASTHFSSNEQVCVGKIEVGISCTRQHEFYRTPESRDVKG